MTIEHTGEEMTLEDMLRRASFLRRELAAYKPLQDELDTLKEHIQFAMTASKSKRTDPVSGVYAVRQQRVSTVVEDEEAVENWLADNVDSLDSYHKLDLKAVESLQKQWLNDYGELIPGLGQQIVEYVSIREDKGK